MKKLMILGASILQLPAIKTAKRMGLEVIAVDMNPRAMGFDVEGIRKEVISTVDTERILELAKRIQIDGVMTLASDMPIRSIAAVSKEMGLVGVTEDTALKATNKVKMRDALAENNVPVPMYFRVSDRGEFLTAVGKIRDAGFRCIVKPADNSGSRGVDLIENYGREALARAYEYSKEYSRSGDLIVEEFMEGAEVSVETISENGICHVVQITDKLTTGAPYFVEMGHSEPSILPKKVQEQIRQVAIAANRAIGIENGPSHTEIKVMKNGPKIVELGARLGGDNITTHLVPLSTGVDMVECCIRIALGEKPDLKAKFSKGSAIRYIKAPRGKIKRFEGVEKAQSLNGVKQISILHGVDEYSREIKCSTDRIGFVIAQADTPETVVQICEDALKYIEVKVDQDDL